MNYYENKKLQDRESRLLASGIVFLVFGLPIAFILGVFSALEIGLPFSPTFYVLWIALEIAGLCGIVASVREKIDRKRNQNS